MGTGVWAAPIPHPVLIVLLEEMSRFTAARMVGIPQRIRRPSPLSQRFEVFCEVITALIDTDERFADDDLQRLELIRDRSPGGPGHAAAPVAVRPCARR